MKWAFFIYDPKGIIKYPKINNSDVIVFIFKQYEDIVKYARQFWHNYDNILFVYDGHWILDGIANQAIYTLCYQTDYKLSHLTEKLIDEKLKTAYSAKNGNKLLEEVETIFEKRFNSF
jgi:hypothetical protein